jgi:protein-S-isoprenylcysteine O-methyltransferase Ste14
MFAVLARLVADAALIAIVLFSAAGTLEWAQAWVLLSVMLIVRVAGAIVVYRVSPALLRERAKLPIHRDQPAADKALLLSVVFTGFVALPMLAGLDVFRWHLLPRPVPAIAYVGLALFTLGWGLKSLALRANAFATSVVRVQSERHHAVADTGVYTIVRHPFYVGTVMVIIGMPLWLSSYAAALFAIVPIVFILLRLTMEERFLRRSLPGYDQYAARVPHRLLPGIW